MPWNVQECIIARTVTVYLRTKSVTITSTAQTATMRRSAMRSSAQVRSTHAHTIEGEKHAHAHTIDRHLNQKFRDTCNKKLSQRSVLQALSNKISSFQDCFAVRTPTFVYVTTKFATESHTVR